MLGALCMCDVFGCYACKLCAYASGQCMLCMYVFDVSMYGVYVCMLCDVLYKYMLCMYLFLCVYATHVCMLCAYAVRRVSVRRLCV